VKNRLANGVFLTFLFVVLLVGLGCSTDQSPRSSSDFCRRGIEAYENQEYDKAIGDFTEAIRLDPRSARAYTLRGDVFSDRKEYDRAIEDYTQALGLDGTNADTLNSRGVAFLGKKDYDRAVSDFSQAIQTDPRHALASNNLAWILATCPTDGLRNGSKAVELATNACELSGWQVAHPLDTLAAAYAESGHFEEAVKWQKKALELGCGDKELAEKAVQRLERYQAGKPHREE
jgi:tetratricopeptide (TPR) repeat protein